MCTERDIINGLTCTECGKVVYVVYVGKTGQQLKEGVEEHLCDIKLNRDNPVAVHFNSNRHSIHIVQVSVLEKVHGQSKALRLIRESEWINTLDTKRKVRKKSRECHNHKPQPFPDPKRKRKPTNANKHKSKKHTKSTKISSLFP